mmetsp:Transcript_27723/g.20818  ORF Transcript_27723/g.20818 Transcript_27723/m.20818 type:complete len:146 (-) Transcript_27723:56-493(-)
MESKECRYECMDSEEFKLVEDSTFYTDYLNESSSSRDPNQALHAFLTALYEWPIDIGMALWNWLLVLVAWVLIRSVSRRRYDAIMKEGRRQRRLMRRRWRELWGQGARENTFQETSSFITDKMLNSDDEGAEKDEPVVEPRLFTA